MNFYVCLDYEEIRILKLFQKKIFFKNWTNYGCLLSYCVSNYCNGHFSHQSYVMYKISAIQVIYKSNASTSKKSKP